MTGTELRGPKNCAECGTDLNAEIVLSGDAGALAFTIEGHSIAVPGLYVCTPCAGAIMVGEKQSGVTLEAAAEFLAGSFIPAVAAYMAVHDGDEHESAHARLHDALNVAEILVLANLAQLFEKAADAEGCDPEDLAIVVIETGPQHPRELATFN